MLVPRDIRQRPGVRIQRHGAAVCRFGPASAATSGNCCWRQRTGLRARRHEPRADGHALQSADAARRLGGRGAGVGTTSRSPHRAGWLAAAGSPPQSTRAACAPGGKCNLEARGYGCIEPSMRLLVCCAANERPLTASPLMSIPRLDALAARSPGRARTASLRMAPMQPRGARYPPRRRL
jgi:hypothetical protein